MARNVPIDFVRCPFRLHFTRWQWQFADDARLLACPEVCELNSVTAAHRFLTRLSLITYHCYRYEPWIRGRCCRDGASEVPGGFAGWYWSSGTSGTSIAAPTWRFLLKGHRRGCKRVNNDSASSLRPSERLSVINAVSSLCPSEILGACILQQTFRQADLPNLPKGRLCCK